MKTLLLCTLCITIIFSSCKNEEKTLYEKVKLENTSSSYQEYLNLYPDGEFKLEITDSLNLQLEKDLYNNAKASSSVVLFEEYLSKYPNGRYTNEVSEFLKSHTGIFTDARDGKEYKWVKIGDQIWMAENLAFKTSKGSWAYDDDEENVVTYGLLYTLKAAKKACPEGWHLPSIEEWKKLVAYLGKSNNAGGKLKSKSSLWSAPNKGATNSSGFSVLPAGLRWGYKKGKLDPVGEYNVLGSHTKFWTSSLLFNVKPLTVSFNSKDGIADTNDSQSEGNAFSVRCIKD